MLIFPGKIPIRINPFFLVLIIFIGWVNSGSIPGTLIWMAVVFLSVLVHEFGHALTAVSFGQEAQIELMALGGITQRRGLPLKHWQDFLIVLNGPLAGLSLAFLAFLLREPLRGQPIVSFAYAVEVAFVVNLFWTVINLLPIQPLDGGHLLRIFLEGIFGFSGVKIAYFLSFVLSAIVCLAFISQGLILMGSLFFMFTFEGYRTWASLLAIKEQDQNVSLQGSFKKAEGEMRAGNLEGAYRQFQQIREEAQDGLLFVAATESMAQILSRSGKQQEVYELLHPYQKRLSPEGTGLLHQSAYYSGNWEEAILLGNRLFQHHPGYDVALINALCHAALGQAQPAVGWLRSAIKEGLPNLAGVLKKREFDPIRASQPFQILIEEL